MILVTGATGFVGRHVVEQLVKAGERVRAMTRDPARAVLSAGFPAGVEVVGGDLLEPATVPVDGVDRMYLFPEPRTTTEVVARAKAAGVRRIVTLSSGAVTAGFDTDFQYPVEQAVEQSGLEWTHLRPGEFSSNATRLWAHSIRAERVVRYILPNQIGVPIHDGDIAAVGVAALLEDGHHGNAYDLSGPERITMREKAHAIGAALGEEVRFEEVTRERALEILTAVGGWAAENAPFLLGFEDYSATTPMPELTEEEWFEMIVPLPTVKEVTGREARTFAEWARDNVDAFR